MINLKYAVVGLAALGGVALASGTASAMPNGMPAGRSAFQCRERGDGLQCVGPLLVASELLCRSPGVSVCGYVGPRYYGGGWGYRRGWGRRW